MGKGQRAEGFSRGNALTNGGFYGTI